MSRRRKTETETERKMREHRDFRDFLYDWNDVIIAIAILAVACLVILWRVNVIMQYPKQLVKDNTKSISQMDSSSSSNSGSSSSSQSSSSSSASSSDSQNSSSASLVLRSGDTVHISR